MSTLRRLQLCAMAAMLPVFEGHRAQARPKLTWNCKVASCAKPLPCRLLGQSWSGKVADQNSSR